jgi:hypothetical protein
MEREERESEEIKHGNGKRRGGGKTPFKKARWNSNDGVNVR